MPIDNQQQISRTDTLGYFSESYAAARVRLLAAAGDCRGRVRSVRYPVASVCGEPLWCDIVDVGSADAPLAAILISGTHGVEGYFGSAVQLLLLKEFALTWPPELRVLLVHAINPYGFAWDRRVTEENIDLNRNFVDFERPLRVTSDY